MTKLERFARGFLVGQSPDGSAGARYSLVRQGGSGDGVARKSSRALTKGWIATLASVGLGAGMLLDGEVHLDPYKSGIK